MNLEESKKWTGYIAKKFPTSELTDIGVVLDEDTVMNAQRNQSGTQWQIELRKIVGIEQLPFSRKVEKKFSKIAAPVFAANRMDGFVVDAEDGSTLLIGVMRIVGVYDEAQLDGLINQFNSAPYEASAALEVEFGLI